MNLTGFPMSSYLIESRFLMKRMSFGDPLYPCANMNMVKSPFCFDSDS